MTKITLTIILTLIFTISGFVQDADNLGEDFDLEALPGILEKVNNLEELEKAINEEDNDVNNLDLNGDGEIDYVLVHEEAEGDTHIAFLRVAMSEDEYQDVATIEMEKQSSSTAIFQIVGDEALYGKDYILEPEDGGVVDISESGSGNKGGSGPSIEEESPFIIRIAIVTGVFRVSYKVFISPWGFGRRPVWFRARTPMGRNSFRSRSAHSHRKSFRRTSNRRSSSARGMQQKGRKTSKKTTQNKNSKNTKSTATKSNQKSTQQKANTQQKSNTQKKKKKNELM